MNELKGREGTRFSGAEWADQLTRVLLVGAGGIGSWLAVNLARIGHELFIQDGDQVDETNVTGGQMFSRNDLGRNKTAAVMDTCRQYGSTNSIYSLDTFFVPRSSILPITITGLDNMQTRKMVFENWVKYGNGLGEKARSEMLLIDGRLTLEMYEVFAIHHTPEQLLHYKKHDLFTDEEGSAVGCTVKQSTFSAMGIGSMITAVLCNHLTNLKYGMAAREVPYYQRMYLPAFDYTKRDVGEIDKYYEREEITTGEEVPGVNAEAVSNNELHINSVLASEIV